MHSPHHVPREWADKYAGQFDDGWDAYREKTFARQKALGIVPQAAVLSRHDPDVQQWETLSADEKRLYARMMEVFAGFLEHTDHYIGEFIRFTPTGKPDIANGKGTPGTVKLLLDGQEVGHGDLPVTTPLRLGQGGAMLVGADTGAPVTPEYQPPFRFTGRLRRIILDISGEHVEDYEAQMRVALATQ